jgi:hypothetical protein
VARIVHGHEHRDITEALTGPAGPVPVRGIPSGTYFPGHGQHKPRNRARIARYRIFEIAGGRVLSDHVRIWNRDRREFVAESAVAPPAARDVHDDGPRAVT